MTPSDVMRALRNAGVAVIRLDARTGADDLEADVLVPRGQRQLAMLTLDRADWRFDVGNRGLWRATRRASYGWDEGLVIHLHWGLPAGPLPSRALAHLERLAWKRARRMEDGALVLDPAVQLAIASVQVARPERRRERWRRTVAQAVGQIESWPEAARVAAASRTPGSVRRALPSSVPLTPASESVCDRTWRLSSRLERGIRSRRIGALITGEPLIGRSVRRCRFAGIEVLAGPGVFRPMAVTEHMVEAALAAIRDDADVTVLEAGTGCGAVSLAIAARRRDAAVHAADVSAAGLRWARRNQRSLGTRVHFHRGSILDPFPASLEREVAVVAGNLPYVPSEYRRSAAQDTPGAVRGEDEDGLGLVRRLASDARRFLRPGGHLLIQMLSSQWEALADDLLALGYRPGAVVGARGPHVVVTATLP